MNINSQGFAVDQRERFLEAQKLTQSTQGDVFDDLTNLINSADSLINQSNQGVAHDEQQRYELEQSLTDKKTSNNLLPLFLGAAALYFLSK